jgi:hypothetical protein
MPTELLRLCLSKVQSTEDCSELLLALFVLMGRNSRWEQHRIGRRVVLSAVTAPTSQPQREN